MKNYFFYKADKNLLSFKSATGWITIYTFVWHVVIYLIDIAIQFLNNWSMVQYIYPFTALSQTRKL